MNESMVLSLVFAKLCLMTEVKIITFSNVVHNVYKIGNYKQQKAQGHEGK